MRIFLFFFSFRVGRFCLASRIHVQRVDFVEKDAELLARHALKTTGMVSAPEIPENFVKGGDAVLRAENDTGVVRIQVEGRMVECDWNRSDFLLVRNVEVETSGVSWKRRKLAAAEQTTACEYSTTMFMEGFEWARRSKACLNLWFETWTLRSDFGIGAGMTIVATSSAALEFSSSLSSRTSPPRGTLAATTQVAWHALTLTLSYLVMMAAMSYSIELFLAVVLGSSIARCVVLSFFASGKKAEEQHHQQHCR